MSADPPGWLHAGRVGRPHGLDGSFHVVEVNAGLLGAVDSLTVDGREREIVRRAGTVSRPILRLQGSEDREAAEEIRGRDLLVPRDAAPGLEEDEWWAEDLIGCAVHDGARAVGTVRRMLELPSCEVLEVQPDRGGAPLLVPMVRDAIREIDTAAQAIEVNADFLDLPEPPADR